MSVSKTHMYKLRERLAQDFDDLLKNGEVAMDHEGNPIMVDGKVIVKRPSPAMYNVIRQFLRDNGIDRDPIDTIPGQKAVTNNLPFVEDPSEIEGLPAHLQIEDQ